LDDAVRSALLKPGTRRSRRRSPLPRAREIALPGARGRDAARRETADRAENAGARFPDPHCGRGGPYTLPVRPTPGGLVARARSGYSSNLLAPRAALRGRRAFQTRFLFSAEKTCELSLLRLRSLQRPPSPPSRSPPSSRSTASPASAA